MKFVGAVLLVLVLAAGASGAVLYDAQLPGHARAVQAAQWFSNAWSHAVASPTDSPYPNPSAEPAPTPFIIPANLPTMPPASAWVPPPTNTPADAISTPIAARYSLPWSPTDLNWVVTTLEQDKELDTQAESAYPDAAAYYAMYAQRWTTCLLDVRQFEAGASPAATQRSDPLMWFAMATDAHESDATLHPQNEWWDGQWEANYARLVTLWNRL